MFFLTQIKKRKPHLPLPWVPYAAGTPPWGSAQKLQPVGKVGNHMEL